MKKKIPNPNKMKRIDGPKMTMNQLARAKVRVTTYLDEDVLSELRRTASNADGKYQTLLNQILRDALLGHDSGLLNRIEKLEKAVFRKKAA